MREENEIPCMTCDGAGTVPTNQPDNGNTVKWGVKVCTGCNGHGLILYINHRVYKWSHARGAYETILIPDMGTATRINA